jgi:hypothetical protein
VDDDLLVMIGKVAVGSAHVESAARDIAFALGLEPKLMMSEICRQIHRRIGDLPAQTQPAAVPITAWVWAGSRFSPHL